LPVLSLLCAVAVPTAAVAQERTVIVAPGYSYYVVLDTLGVPSAVSAPREEVFRALLTVYEALKVPLSLEDSVGFRLGNAGFRRTGSFAGKRISSWLSCGEGLTGPFADYYRVTISLHTLVQPGPDGGSRLRTALLAGAENLSEGGRQPVACTSHGLLESRIRTMVEEELARRKGERP
jgi:hypothetical protein